MGKASWPAGGAVIVLLATACADGSGGPAEAEAPTGDWPEELTLYIPNPPGGGFDIAARAMQPQIAEAIGNDVVPVNQDGAGGAVAAEQMLSEPADGNRMMIVSRTISSLPYTGTPELDPLHDLEPIGVTHRDVSALSVAADSPYESVEDLLVEARDNPGDITIGTSGEGGVWHAAGVVLEQAADVEFEFIPYEGGSDAGQAVASGEVDATTIGAPETAPFIENDSLRMLGVMDSERVGLFPDVPTFAEAGVDDVEYVVWRGFVVSSETPEDVRAELGSRVEEAVTSEATVEAMEDAGFDPTWEGTEEMRALMEGEDALFPELFADTDVVVSEPER
ncbi:tripartite tricarboxylate transporter substrate binding protein [Allosalinactinospora lopnorensis]|uniref:tripartite tricarboxylate transporter substrate binding protein n=1 Tax=Allosalinactinospora lopnorensis TaxID=1352348 RepID=UPI000623DBE7|nr:tripartite tricarboxylate transporter substrate binding protein [Allosalinactinospora lopnorensis]